MNRLFTIALAALVLGTGVPLIPSGPGAAQAAERGKARARKGSGGKSSKARKPAAPKPAEVEGAAPAAEDSAPAPAPPAAAASDTGSARAGKPRVYTFGGLDLEGKLKTPQLLYFRGRMRQELDASSLQRRSFLKELEKTADDQGL